MQSLYRREYCISGDLDVKVGVVLEWRSSYTGIQLLLTFSAY